tara:strand:- start:218 stop:523 length:306 start_codon:yes stop_codon:yes gene_type:complete
MEKTLNFINEAGMAAYSTIILCVGYSIRWFLLKLKSLIVQDVWKKVDERIELQMKSIADLAFQNKKNLEELQATQQQNYIKILENLNNLQESINKSLTNDK